jgi:hypothetical protein
LNMLLLPALVAPEPEARLVPALLQQLRADAGPASLETVEQELDKLDCVRGLQLPIDLFAAVPPRVLQDLRQRAAVEALYELRRHPEPLLITLLTGYCYVRGQDRVECAHEAIKAWCQMWYWDSSAVLKLKQADRVWHVLPA